MAEFSGRFGWGYDGVNLFAPTRLYGRPDDFRRFVDQAHALGIAVILDVVYNHFGADGNYLNAFSAAYFTDRYANEWGEAINFDGPDVGPVREFFLANAGYWVDEYHLDGPREADGYLYDVVDGENGDDPSFRPNQIFAIALDHPILDRTRWEAVVAAVRERLLTPVGLRSLAPGEPDYKPRYFGDLRARDAAYHQGTVWAWLIGPFIDAWLKVYPDEREAARHFLDGFEPHLAEAGIGSISEVFDAEPPFTPRGCIVQAWSVAEVLRALVKTTEDLPRHARRWPGHRAASGASAARCRGGQAMAVAPAA